MTRFPALEGKDIVTVREKFGFVVDRQRGSHIFLKHPDGRGTVVPIHSGETIGPGLFAKILRDETLKMAMGVNLQSLRTSLEKDTLSAMAWMVADGILDFKLALPRNKLDQGEFHDKFGICSQGFGRVC